MTGQRMDQRKLPAASRASASLLLCLPLVALVTLRGDTRDSDNYVDAFWQSTKFPWDPLEYYSEFGMEWGFGIASWLLNTLGLSPVSLFFLVSLATFYFLGKAVEYTGLRFTEVAPYYLGSFFLVQQLMQIRQGLAMAFVLGIIVLIARPSPRPWWKLPLNAAVAVCIQFTSLVPMLSAHLLRKFMPRPTRWRVVIWLLAIVAVTVVAARAFMSLEVIASLGRLSIYASDTEYSGERGLLAPANLRATLLFLLMVFGASAALLRSRLYVLMLGLYAAHIGLRYGFYDFLILSGRLSTTLGFTEVLLMPLLVRDRIRSPWLRTVLALLYLCVHAAITLLVQSPYLIDDYFTPLRTDYASP